MSVVELVDDFIVDFRRQFFKPVAVVAAQGDVQRDEADTEGGAPPGAAPPGGPFWGPGVDRWYPGRLP